MLKLLPIGVVAVLMLGVLLYIRFGGTMKNSIPQAAIDSSVQSSSSSEERLTALEIAVATLKNDSVSPAPQAKSTSSGSDAQAADTENRLKALETAVADIRQKLGQTSTVTVVPAAPTKRTPVYIPLGAGGRTTDQGGEILSLFEASINPDDYSGYSGMQLEVNLRMTQAAGTAYARLYNFTDNQSIAASEVSTTSDKSIWITSSSFKLSGGQKTYRLWAKTSQGFATEIQSARLKVSF